METKNMIGGIVSLAVVVICVAAIMMPVLSDATETQGSVTNEGLYNMKEYQTTDTFTAKWDYTKPYQMTVNGEVANFPSTAGQFDYTLMGNEQFSARFFFDSGSTRILQVFTGTDVTNVYQAKTSSGGSNMEITLSEGVLTFDNGSGTTASVTLTDSFYCVNNDGEYTMKAYNESSMVMEDTELIAIGVSVINKSNNTTVGERFFIEGSIEDGFTATGLPFEVTLSTITPTYADSTNTYLVDLLDFSKIEFTATYDSTETDVTYSQMLVPTEVSGELSNHLADSERALLDAIPAMVIVAIIVAAIGIFVTAKRD